MAGLGYIDGNIVYRYAFNKSKCYSFIWLQKLCSSGWSPKEDAGSALPSVCAHIIGQNIIIKKD